MDILAHSHSIASGSLSRLRPDFYWRISNLSRLPPTLLVTLHRLSRVVALLLYDGSLPLNFFNVVVSTIEVIMIHVAKLIE